MAPVRLWVEAWPAGIPIRKMLPLSDTLVLDLTQVIAGPTAGQILGDMGADVIKVEPLHGEHFRPQRPLREGLDRLDQRVAGTDVHSGVAVSDRLLAGQDWGLQIKWRVFAPEF